MSLVESILNVNEILPHRAHQLDGVVQLVSDVDLTRAFEHRGETFRREIPRVFALLDEVGAGKTKQIVDSSQILYGRGNIDTVVVVAPGYARSTWAEQDPALGEVAKHSWASVLNIIHEYHGKHTIIDFSARGLHWVVTNFEFIRRDERRDDLIRQLRGRRVWIVVDESWNIANNSDQTRAVTMIRRKRAEYATILNGTPLNDGKPKNLYYQFAFLDPEIIGARTHGHFKAKYCVLGGYNGRSIVDYHNLDELNARIAPYVYSRRTRDCFDLPPMLPPVIISAKLSDADWKLYREMRDDMAVWLNGESSVARQAIVKILRLAQITSGYLGGLEVDADGEAQDALPEIDQQLPSWMAAKLGGKHGQQTQTTSQAPAQAPPHPARAVSLQPGHGNSGAAKSLDPFGRVTREIGRAKLDALLDWFGHAAPERFIVWCRFKKELARTTDELRKLYPVIENLRGGQTPLERSAAKKLLAPGSKTRGGVVGNPAAGGASLNFSAANLMVFLSYGPRLIERTQAIGRIERPGATAPMTVIDVVATGPKGQQTIDHKILKALRAKDDMANWTVGQWRKLLDELKAED